MHTRIYSPWQASRAACISINREEHSEVHSSLCNNLNSSVSLHLPSQLTATPEPQHSRLPHLCTPSLVISIMPFMCPSSHFLVNPWSLLTATPTKQSTNQILSLPINSSINVINSQHYPRPMAFSLPSLVHPIREVSQVSAWQALKLLIWFWLSVVIGSKLPICCQHCCT